MPNGPTFPGVLKDPSAVLEYGFDLALPALPGINQKPWLAAGETVTTLTVTADAGITVVTSSINTNATGVLASLLLAWIAGGAVGVTYSIRFLFVTSQGRTDTRTLQITVASR